MTDSVVSIIFKRDQLFLQIVITPPLVRGRGIVIEQFLCLFVYVMSATLRENGWTDLHEIFREGVE